MPVSPEIPKDISRLRSIAKLLDAQFRIPGTGVRFGIDPIIGLIPGAGDFAGFLMSAYMISILAKNGASGFVLARMVLNSILDSLLGSIPLLGDLFDFAFKANQRNLRLLEEHYLEGRHRGGAWKVIVPVVLLLFGCLAGMVWLLYKFYTWLMQ